MTNQVTTQELALSNALQLEALTQLGIKKELWTAEEFLVEVQIQREAFVKR
ncbi:MAG: hypothetical protein HRU15_01100 [Planctomycetes bacterium]|nr:hypothetical protein [Planctomycetota bacterium]